MNPYVESLKDPSHSYYQPSSVNPGVYSYNSISASAIPGSDGDRLLRYVPKRQTSGEVTLDIGESASVDTDSRADQNLRLRGTHDDSGRMLLSAIKPFQKRSSGMINTVTKELKTVLAEKQGWKIFWLLLGNIALTFVLFVYSGSTNSLALTAFSYLTIFDVLSLFTCLLSLWVSLQKPTSAFSFGYERYEVLAVFSSTILTMFGALFIFKESIERLLLPVEIVTDSLFFLSIAGLFLHLLVTFAAGNKPLQQVSKAAASNWLQDAVTDLGHSICGFTPMLGRALIQKFNPIALLGIAGALSVLITDACVDYNKSFIADSLCAMVMTSIIWATMLPLSVYSGQALLQTCPVDIMSQIDKCLREASTLDGVLEFRNEHFWTVSFGRMAGSLHVRIRRDANEQMVLAHVINKLSHLVSDLTIQVFKDDWIRSTSGTKLATLSSLPQTFHQSPSLPKINQSPSPYVENTASGYMPYRAGHGQAQAPLDKPQQNYATSPNSGYIPASKRHHK
ncbi:zinc transporter 6 isoform X3 [Nematostella vectensis]|nr:zinc transporter 6 isoform X3 [Nematostella vectensis]